MNLVSTWAASLLKDGFPFTSVATYAAVARVGVLGREVVEHQQARAQKTNCWGSRWSPRVTVGVCTPGDEPRPAHLLCDADLVGGHAAAPSPRFQKFTNFLIFTECGVASSPWASHLLQKCVRKRAASRFRFAEKVVDVNTGEAVAFGAIGKDTQGLMHGAASATEPFEQHTHRPGGTHQDCQQYGPRHHRGHNFAPFCPVRRCLVSQNAEERKN